MWTDGQTEITKLIVAFFNFAKALRNVRRQNVICASLGILTQKFRHQPRREYCPRHLEVKHNLFC